MNNATFHIITFGCQMNVNDSDWLKRALERRGFVNVAAAEEAQVIILNTCSVREKPEQKVYQALRSVARGLPERGFAVVAGCVAQQVGEGFFKRFPKVRLVVGSDGLRDAPDAIVRLWSEADTRLDLTAFAAQYPERERVLAPLSVGGSARLPSLPDLPDLPGLRDLRGGQDAGHESSPHESSAGTAPAVTPLGMPAVTRLPASPPETSAETPPSAFVNIMQGCDNYCAYCIVPYTRGPQKSRTVEAVLDECADLVQRGVREITLLGQNVNAFGMDGGRSAAPGRGFADLVRQVAAVPNLARLRFVTPHPKDFAPETVALFGELPNLCPRLHLPLQAGSDAVLAAMGRKYGQKDFLRLVEALRSARPELALSTDLIVGFPGETEADFQQTLQTMRDAAFMSSFSFCYSDRPGTRASAMADKVPAGVQKERLLRLQSLQDELSAVWLAGQVGVKTEVLLDRPSRRQQADQMQGPMSWQGQDPWGATVNVSLDTGHPGLLVPVTITAAKRHSLSARLLSTSAS